MGSRCCIHIQPMIDRRRARRRRLTVDARTRRLLFAAALIAGLASVHARAQRLPLTGTLRASFLATNPVHARVDAVTGAISGPVADLTAELARRSGLEFRLLPEPDAAAIIASLERGDSDIGFLAYEAARATRVDFSEPFALMGNAYLVRADAPFRRSADLDATGVLVAAAKGQSPQVWVSEHLRTAQVAVRGTMPPNAVIVSELVGGEITAFAASRQRMEDVAAGDTRVRVVQDNFSVVPQALVVRKGEAALLAAMNQFVADVVASGFVQASLQRAKLSGVEVPPGRGN